LTVKRDTEKKFGIDSNAIHLQEAIKYQTKLDSLDEPTSGEPSSGGKQWQKAVAESSGASTTPCKY
jgi:hypothetical protein